MLKHKLVSGYLFLAVASFRGDRDGADQMIPVRLYSSLPFCVGMLRGSGTPIGSLWT